MSIKTMNDVDALYDSGVKALKNGLFLCPVCDKSYQQEHSAKKHVEKRSCHKLQDIVQGTVHETKGYNLYKELVAAMKPTAKVTLQGFRKSPMYNPVMRFTMFCSLHEVFDSNTYLSWLNEIKGIQYANQLMVAGISEVNLREFRLFAQKYDLMPSEKFYQAYREDLLTDDDFLVRAIEKSRIGVRFLAAREDFPFEERLESLPADYQHRIMAVLDEVI